MNLVFYYTAEDLTDAEDPSETTGGTQVLETVGNCSPVEYNYTIDYSSRKKIAVGKALQN